MDIAKKAKTLRERRLIRSQLVGAPLLVAQTGLVALRRFLSGGNPGLLEGIRLGDHLSVAEVLNALGGAPPLTVLKLLYDTGGDYCVEQLDKVKNPNSTRRCLRSLRPSSVGNSLERL